jgi:peptidoglycan/xylan/chitin deacetylase (PgdA/CDA1 family)
MKRVYSLLTAVIFAGFGSFFSNLKQTFHVEKETTIPSTTQVPYIRPKGIHAAPAGSGKLIALTFDDGPGGKVTNHILDSLNKVGGHATFFCLGERAETYSKTMRRIIAQGSEVASHSYSHERLTRLSTDDLNDDLYRTELKLEEISGKTPKLLRPPYGSVSERVCNNAEMPVILWSIDSEDWRYCEELCKHRSEEQREQDFIKVVNSVLDYVQDGDIILMHDLYSFTQDVADAVIAELHHQGWQFVTVSELFQAKGIIPEAGAVYYCAR